MLISIYVIKDQIKFHIINNSNNEIIIKWNIFKKWIMKGIG